MSKTWREAPKGPPKDPRPPEKGGHKNIYKIAVEEEIVDLDEIDNLDEEAWVLYEES